MQLRGHSELDFRNSHPDLDPLWSKILLFLYSDPNLPIRLRVAEVRKSNFKVSNCSSAFNCESAEICSCRATFLADCRKNGDSGDANLQWWIAKYIVIADMRLVSKFLKNLQICSCAGPSCKLQNYDCGHEEIARAKLWWRKSYL